MPFFLILFLFLLELMILMKIHAILRIWLLYTLDSIYEYPFVHDYCENTPFYYTPFYSTSSPSNSWNIVSPMEYQIINNQPWMR